MDLIDLFENPTYGPAPESAALAQEWLERHGRKFRHYINGDWSASTDDRFFETFCPANGNSLADVSHGTLADVNHAVASAKSAFEAWSIKSGFERAQVLYALARQIQKHSRLFAVLESLDNGKPIRETRDIDIPLVARHFYHHAGWASHLKTEFQGYEPLGVIGQIIPWNFPLLMLAWKIAPAIAAGNTVVLKPAEFTPLTALLFAEICTAAGVPPGVINIVTGDGETGSYLVQHPDVAKIAFTGSTEVGRILRDVTAGTDKKLSLELGGKSPFIVFEDADLDSAVEGIVDAIWFNQGQVCCAGSRLLVQESVAPALIRKIRARMENLRVGDPLDKAVDIGALIAPIQLQKVSELVELGVKEGATKFQPTWSCPTEGWYYPPTLLTEVSPSSTVAQVEIFGPVLVSMTFRTPKEAIELANNTRYGLAASVWSENLNLAHDVASKVKAGTVWINSTNLFDANAGFGGYRESGFGREGGREGLYEYLKFKFPRAGENRALSVIEGQNTPIDRTHKLYIGGKQVRPDSGYSLEIKNAKGGRIGEIGLGNRKDIRNAVEAARAAQSGWAASSAHLRAQILYYLAENLQSHSEALSNLIAAFSSRTICLDADSEIQRGVRRLFEIAGLCDKYDGVLHQVPMKGYVYTLNEPLGVVGVVCPDEAALLPFITCVGTLISMGNCVVVLAGENAALPIAEFVHVIETSDVPAGVINIITGKLPELETTMAEHADIDAVWHFGSAVTRGQLEKLSVTNLKQTWGLNSSDYFWAEEPWMSAAEFFRHATQVKNVWVPMGE